MHVLFLHVYKRWLNECTLTQCGFRSGRGTVDIFCVRQLQEKASEQQTPLHAAFVDLTKAFGDLTKAFGDLTKAFGDLTKAFGDLTKAFDYKNREALFTILKKVGCPPISLELFHENMQGTAQVDGMISEHFPIVNDVKQGCVLATTLFWIYSNLANPAVGLITRIDANLFSTSRLKAKTKTTTLHVCEDLCADDAAFCSHSEEQLQSIIDSFSNTCSALGFKISIKKTVVTSHGTQAAKITLNDETLETVENYAYLGSIMSNHFTLDINTRIGKATPSFDSQKEIGPTRA